LGYFHKKGLSTHSKFCRSQASPALHSAIPSSPAPSAPVSPLPPSQSLPFLSPFRLWDFIPHSLWPRWRDSCRSSFVHYCRASALGPSASSAALSAILSLPSKFLIRDRGGKRGFQALRSRLSRPLPAPPPPVQPVASSSTYRVSPFASRIARAKALLERGHISRATRCLFQRGLAPLVPSTVESLRKLHPPASESKCPSLPDSAPRIHVDGVVLSDLVMRKVANGSAPGPSGWSGELVKALLGDADCLAGLVTLVEDIVYGDLVGSCCYPLL